MSATAELPKVKEISGKMREITDGLQKKYKDDDIEEGDVLVGLGKLLQLKKDLLKVLNGMYGPGSRSAIPFEYWFFTLEDLDKRIEHCKTSAESWWTFIVSEGALESKLTYLSSGITKFDEAIKGFIGI